MKLSGIARWLSRVLPATKKDILTLLQKMSAISDELALVKGSLDAANATLATLTTGVKALDDKIITLLNTVTGLTPEEQAALDAVRDASAALAVKAAAIDTSIPTGTPPAPPA